MAKRFEILRIVRTAVGDKAYFDHVLEDFRQMSIWSMVSLHKAQLGEDTRDAVMHYEAIANRYPGLATLVDEYIKECKTQFLYDQVHNNFTDKIGTLYLTECLKTFGVEW